MEFVEDVILAQSDTTAGFFSYDAKKLNMIKNSPPNKPLLQVSPSLKALNPRVPLQHKALARRTKATLACRNSQAWRVIQDPLTLNYLERLGVIYSTSANLSTQPYDYQIAFGLAQTIIEDRRGLYASQPSQILKLSKTRKKRLR
ncbi:N6-threonylcarbamoyl adenosine t(6)A37 modification in tRNA [Helicobacter bizzozeronii]|uniref:N6-threonylcarbamoyl adenosine t(6)A37 modification in tRNA n=1 Tax=Helicobacter bizzozeronii TaxID=56877 RepID=UPI0018F83F3A|nr:N6-threonylcarbamoyl adenosine t(6)A37 modification in tRNA [Helicobacter bizzozeronii]